MEQINVRLTLTAGLLALAFGLSGCQKADEAPAHEMDESGLSAPDAMSSEPESMTDPDPTTAPAPGVEPAPTDIPMEPVPGEAGEAAPSQPATDDTPGTDPQ